MQDPSTEGPGLTPGQGTRSQMPQLKVCMPQRKIPHVTSKTQHSQKKKRSAPRPRCQCGPWTGAGMGSISAQTPCPSPALGGLRKGVVGHHGEGCPCGCRKSVLQHALHRLGHLREEQSLHHPRRPWGRRAQASPIATLCPAYPGHIRAPTPFTGLTPHSPLQSPAICH